MHSGDNYGQMNAPCCDADGHSSMNTAVQTSCASVKCQVQPETKEVLLHEGYVQEEKAASLSRVCPNCEGAEPTAHLSDHVSYTTNNGERDFQSLAPPQPHLSLPTTCLSQVHSVHVQSRHVCRHHCIPADLIRLVLLHGGPR